MYDSPMRHPCYQTETGRVRFSMSRIENLDCRNRAGEIQLCGMKRMSQGMRLGTRITRLMAGGRG